MVQPGPFRSFQISACYINFKLNITSVNQTIVNLQAGKNRLTYLFESFDFIPKKLSLDWVFTDEVFRIKQ